MLPFFLGSHHGRIRPPIFKLRFLASGQAQKHVTVNESLTRLDALVQLASRARALAWSPQVPPMARSTSCARPRRCLGRDVAGYFSTGVGGAGGGVGTGGTGYSGRNGAGRGQGGGGGGRERRWRRGRDGADGLARVWCFF
jgi:hypothetical protein